MLTKNEARALVVAEIQRAPKYPYPDHPTDLVVIDDCTIEREWGWVFFYTSDRYLKTGGIGDPLAGNAPYIVNRHTGELFTTGTANTIDYYIAEYEKKLAGR